MVPAAEILFAVVTDADVDLAGRQRWRGPDRSGPRQFLGVGDSGAIEVLGPLGRNREQRGGADQDPFCLSAQHPPRRGASPVVQALDLEAHRFPGVTAAQELHVQAGRQPVGRHVVAQAEASAWAASWPP